MIVVLLALSGLSACHRVTVQAERSLVATFGRYQNYAWATEPVSSPIPGQLDASLIDRRIRADVDRELAAKGYVRASNASAGMLVDYDLALGPNSPAPYADYFRRRVPVVPTRAVTDEESTLVLEFVDARTGVWAFRASATNVARSGDSPQRLDDAVRQMLESLPPIATGR